MIVIIGSVWQICSFAKLRMGVDFCVGKNQREKYQETKGLIQRGKELCIKFFPDHSIHIRPKTYSLPKVDVVDSKWIQDKMNANRVSLKSIEQLTGIDKSNLSAYVRGLRPMSQPVKAITYSHIVISCFSLHVQ